MSDYDLFEKNILSYVCDNRTSNEARFQTCCLSYVTISFCSAGFLEEQAQELLSGLILAILERHLDPVNCLKETKAPQQI